MRWENYELNDTVIPIVDKIKEDAINTLLREYGRIKVDDEDIETTLDYIVSDVFLNFVVLAQELSITRLIDAYAVATHDIDSEKTTVTETGTVGSLGNETLTAGTSVIETSNVAANETSTGTVTDEGKQTNTGDSDTDVENKGKVEATGSKNVSLSHAMPEQALDGTTQKFPVDEQGTPILNTSMVQNGSSAYSTTNPLENIETSKQLISSNSIAETNNKQTNDLKSTNDTMSTRNSTNSGSDTRQTEATDTRNLTTSTIRDLSATNKQYAYEVSAFIKTAGEVNPFVNWTNKFSWLRGII